MEIQYGKNRILLFPQDIEEEIGFDSIVAGTIIVPNENSPHETGSEFEVIDKVVCLRVRRVKQQNETVAPPKEMLRKKKKWFNRS